MSLKNEVAGTADKQSTFDRFLSDPKQKKLYKKEYQELLISELLLAVMEEDKISVRKLAKEAGVSPTIIQGLRSNVKKNLNLSTFKKIVIAMGFHLCLQKKGHKTIRI